MGYSNHPPVAYAVPRENTSPKFAKAWAKGCGGSVIESSTELKFGPVAMFGSPARWAILQQAISEGREWYYGDHAYIGKLTYYRVTKCAYQMSPNHIGVPPDRACWIGVCLACILSLTSIGLWVILVSILHTLFAHVLPLNPNSPENLSSGGQTST